MIILIGMPCSGKSFYSEYLSVLINQIKEQNIIITENLDTDVLFQKKYDMTPFEYIKKYGINKFRENEYLILNNLNENNNFVVSTGGGIIEYNKSLELISNYKNNDKHLVIFLFISKDIFKERYRKRKYKINYSNEEIDKLYDYRNLIFEKNYNIKLDCNLFSNKKKNSQEILNYLFHKSF